MSGTSRTLWLSACFVLGFSSVFIALGASATGLSGLLLAYRYETNIVGGALIILFGLFMMGVLRLPWLQRDHRIHTHLRGGHPAAAYTLGLAFGFGWTPCIGPILGAILTVSAMSATATDGIALLAIYSAGLGIPFLVCALFLKRIAGPLKAMRRTGRYLEIGAGAVMVVMGFAMITGRLSQFSFWLLEQFPILTTIG
jgi:cytochrome c-type biogenesis protein